MSLNSQLQARRDARWRRRRVIFNDDGGDVAATKEEFLAFCIDRLTGTQVDALFFCTNMTSTGFLHRTEVAEFYPQGRALYEAEGVDCLEIAVDFAHRNQMELFWSLRMNDTHDAHFTDTLSDLKRAHPNWLLGDVDDPAGGPCIAEYWGRTAFDYTVDEVRDLMVGLIEEVCGRYDVDGIELDLGVCPTFSTSLLRRKI